MSSRHPILKRMTAWTAAAVLLLALYVASVPFVAFWSQAHAPRLRHFWRMLYAPVAVYVQHHDWPGSRAYVRYEVWCDKKLTPYYAKAPLNQKLDGELCDVQFSSTPLSQVADFLSTLHDCRFELDPTANPEISITVTARGPLRTALEQILDPHGLVAAPMKDRIVIGTPTAVQQLVNHSQPKNPLGKVIAFGIVLLCLTLAVWFVRRRVSGRRTARAAASS